MPRIPLIVMEQTGDWAAALRRELPQPAVRLIETRTLEECWRRLAEWPAALVALELTAERVGPLLARLLRMEREFPAARAIVLAERRLAPYGPLVREAGAIHFVDSTRSLGPVAELVRRRLARLAASGDAPAAGADDTLAEILADLPWSETDA